jgi:prepilin-type N-terminal cleavage/methylation domain-containing protein
MKTMDTEKWKIVGAWKPAIRNRRGFSLTEVVLSVAIVAIAAVGVMTAFPTAIMASRESQDENTMALIAQDIFAQLRAAPFTASVPKIPYVSSPQGGPQYARWNLGNYRGGAGVGVNNFFYYSRNGRPANEISNSSKLGCPPAPEDPYKSDEGYFGVRVVIYSDPYNTHLPTTFTNLARVICNISYPARAEWSSTINRRKVKQFVTHIADLR